MADDRDTAIGGSDNRPRANGVVYGDVGFAIACFIGLIYGIAETMAPRIKNGRYVLIPASERTKGHGSHTWAVLWKDELTDLLRRSERRATRDPETAHAARGAAASRGPAGGRRAARRARGR